MREQQTLHSATRSRGQRSQPYLAESSNFKVHRLPLSHSHAASTIYHATRDIKITQQTILLISHISTRQPSNPRTYRLDRRILTPLHSRASSPQTRLNPKPGPSLPVLESIMLVLVSFMTRQVEPARSCYPRIRIWNRIYSRETFCVAALAYCSSTDMTVFINCLHFYLPMCFVDCTFDIPLYFYSVDMSLPSVDVVSHAV